MRGKRKTKTQQAKEGGYLVRSCRLRIDRARLDPELRRELDRAFGVYRHLYNATVEHQRDVATTTAKHMSAVRTELTAATLRSKSTEDGTVRIADNERYESCGTTRCRRSVVRRRSSTIS